MQCTGPVFLTCSHLYKPLTGVCGPGKLPCCALVVMTYVSTEHHINQLHQENIGHSPMHPSSCTAFPPVQALYRRLRTREAAILCADGSPIGASVPPEPVLVCEGRASHGDVSPLSDVWYGPLQGLPQGLSSLLLQKSISHAVERASQSRHVASTMVWV